MQNAGYCAMISRRKPVTYPGGAVIAGSAQRSVSHSQHTFPEKSRIDKQLLSIVSV
jgi:hypothetical protein